MGRSLAICLAALLVACQAPQAVERADGAPRDDAYFTNGFPGLPLDARAVVQKLASCTHFAGEFGGDRSARDREVGAAMTQLHCETMDEDVRQILKKHPNNKQLLNALKEATDV